MLPLRMQRLLPGSDAPLATSRTRKAVSAACAIWLKPSAAARGGLVIRGAGALGVLARDLGGPLLVLSLDGVEEFPVLRPCY